MLIEVGMKGRAETVVVRANTAAAVGSGLLPVFATPMMAALMEQAACDAISSRLEEGQSSVGTRLELTHDSATPIGMKVWAEAEVTEVDGRRISFTVLAFDEVGQIGTCIHQRFIIAAEKFLTKTNAKLSAV